VTLVAEPAIIPYGSWQSPITSDLITSQSIRFFDVLADGDDIYWIESRPTEGGRCVLVKHTPGGAVDVTPEPFYVRSSVHGYGGAPAAVHEGVVYFVNFQGQRIFKQEAPGGEPWPITPEGVDLRYADMVIDLPRGRLICVREDHTGEGEAVNTLVSVDLDGNNAGGRVLAQGHDFFASPRLSPDGTRLAWLTWDHPRMPWDGTELWVADVDDDGALGEPQLVAGGPGESIFQPAWSPGGVLYFTSDRGGWWNLYRLVGGEVEPVLEMEAEFGLPQWVFGMSTYGFADAERIVCVYGQNGIWRLANLDTVSRQLTPIDLPYTSISSLIVSTGRVLCFAASPVESSALLAVDPDTGQYEVLRRSSAVALDMGYLSEPEPVEFPTEGGLTAHAFYYPPKNKDFTAPADERPPLIVISHGGPTGFSPGVLKLGTQFWTSRGFAVLDVNYGGSAGYGRAYRQRLYGQWGVVDVDDCVNGARYLIERGDVDPDRVVIRGGSAGGYTTLCALTMRDFFKAGASYYGVSDLVALAADTHKFESRYLDQLVGPYPAQKALYDERSPINHVDKLACPVIFFQGGEDTMVLPNQAEMMVDVLREKGIPVAYLLFENEGHGFRRAENIKRATDAELYFYAQVFGFAPADAVEPVEIENL
jgi:dipeptidyl aminopeptidase/acylaminoacyl peptidase